VCVSEVSASVVEKVQIVVQAITFSFMLLFERVMFVGILFVEACVAIVKI
jgi:hypothetical protein